MITILPHKDFPNTKDYWQASAKIPGPGCYFCAPIVDGVIELGPIRGLSNCRDSFFTELPRYIREQGQQDYITILYTSNALSARKTQSKLERVQEITEYISPYVDKVRVTFDEDPQINSYTRSWHFATGGSSTIVEEKEVTFKQHLIQIHIPLEMFANVTLIWLYTYFFRLVFDYTRSKRMLYYPEAYLKLLTHSYKDTILTDKKELIYDMWRKMAETGTATLPLYDGPYGVINRFGHKDFLYKIAHKYLNTEFVYKQLPKYVDTEVKAAASCNV